LLKAYLLEKQSPKGSGKHPLGDKARTPAIYERQPVLLDPTRVERSPPAGLEVDERAQE
jgi:hypothetical protein